MNCSYYLLLSFAIALVATVATIPGTRSTSVMLTAGLATNIAVLSAIRALKVKVLRATVDAELTVVSSGTIAATLILSSYRLGSRLANAFASLHTLQLHASKLLGPFFLA